MTFPQAATVPQATRHQTPNFDQCFHFPNASIANMIVSKTTQCGDVFESATTFD